MASRWRRAARRGRGGHVLNSPRHRRIPGTQGGKMNTSTLTDRGGCPRIRHATRNKLLTELSRQAAWSDLPCNPHACCCRDAHLHHLECGCGEEDISPGAGRVARGLIRGACLRRPHRNRRRVERDGLSPERHPVAARVRAVYGHPARWSLALRAIAEERTPGLSAPEPRNEMRVPCFWKEPRIVSPELPAPTRVPGSYANWVFSAQGHPRAEASHRAWSSGHCIGRGES